MWPVCKRRHAAARPGSRQRHSLEAAVGALQQRLELCTVDYAIPERGMGQDITADASPSKQCAPGG